MPCRGLLGSKSNIFHTAIHSPSDKENCWPWAGSAMKKGSVEGPDNDISKCSATLAEWPIDLSD